MYEYVKKHRSFLNLKKEWNGYISMSSTINKFTHRYDYIKVNEMRLLCKNIINILQNYNTSFMNNISIKSFINHLQYILILTNNEYIKNYKCDDKSIIFYFNDGSNHIQYYNNSDITKIDNLIIIYKFNENLKQKEYDNTIIILNDYNNIIDDVVIGKVLMNKYL